MAAADSDKTNPKKNGAESEEETDQQMLQRRFYLGLFYVVLPLLLIYALFKIFPPVPWPTSTAESNKLVESLPIYFFGGRFSISTSLEERLLLLVMVSGAVGSYIHSATSFSDYVGNRQFRKSWFWWYVLRPYIGVGLALVVYFAVRGGLLLFVVNGDAVNDASNINPFGVAAVAGLTGMFSKQAADKLAEVFSTLFKSEGDDKRKDSLTPAPAPAIKDIDPKTGSTEGGTKITITGTGFQLGAKLFFGAVSATNVEVVDETTMTADTPPHGPGPVDVKVENPDNKNTTKISAYTYVAPPPGEQQSPPEDLTSPPGE